jgi:hypothetical protein
MINSKPPIPQRPLLLLLHGPTTKAQSIQVTVIDHRLIEIISGDTTQMTAMVIVDEAKVHLPTISDQDGMDQLVVNEVVQGDEVPAAHAALADERSEALAGIEDDIERNHETARILETRGGVTLVTGTKTATSLVVSDQHHRPEEIVDTVVKKNPLDDCILFYFWMWKTKLT